MDKYLDNNYSINERVEDLISKMSVSEKIAQTLQISSSTCSEEEANKWAYLGVGSFLHTLSKRAEQLQKIATTKSRLKIPVLFGIDATHGHSLYNGATIFPSQLSMAATFNPELIKMVGEITAKEVIADGLHWTFSPLLCLGRDLRWGRINETFGEDPYLTGEMAKALVKGYQGNDLSQPNSILACAKHYLAYGESTGARDSYDSCCSYRKIREVFLEPFRKVVDVNVGSIMSGYQSVDGTPCTINKKLLVDILKHELNFNGFVVTDWKNTEYLIKTQRVVDNFNEASKLTIESGNDMIMNVPEYYEAMLENVKSNNIDLLALDEAVRRILTIKFKLGLFDYKAKTKPNRKIIGCEEHMDINLQVANESVILLKNDNILPLKKPKSIAVIGPLSDNEIDMLGDWTYFTHPLPNPNAKSKKVVITPYKGFKKFKDIKVNYANGCSISGFNEKELKQAIRVAKRSDVIVLVLGDSNDQNGEVKDRANLDLPKCQIELFKQILKLNKTLITVMISGKPLTIPYIVENAKALIQQFSPGNIGGLALANTILGYNNPSGKLPISYAYHSGQLPVYYNQLPGWHNDSYCDMPNSPLFKFSDGLSYSKFEYSNVKTSFEENKLLVKVDVLNNSGIIGKETTFVFINDVVSSVVTPLMQLVAFKKTEIKPHNQVTIEFEIDINELAIINSNEQRVVEEGLFEVMVGSNIESAIINKQPIFVKK